MRNAAFSKNKYKKRKFVRSNVCVGEAKLPLFSLSFQMELFNKNSY